MEVYKKPTITTRLGMNGVVPLAALSLTEAIIVAAGLAGVATGLMGDDKFHPEHMRSLTIDKDIVFS